VSAEGALAMPLVADEAALAAIAYDEAGLVVGVVQEATTREVLMVAYLDAEAVRRTLETGRTWFYSRSRQQYWCKGETSGNRQFVRALRYDCDGDALLIEVHQEGSGACHTGERTCFFRAVGVPGER
jgi:phosphoribosyl-AMP cyclohydrolase